MQPERPFCSGYVSIIGVPNVGKSTLLNVLFGEKLAIVTPKPQTTRNRIAGILTTEDYQIIFLDTPGILNPKYPLQEKMVKAAFSAIESADLILLVIDVSNISAEETEAKILGRIQPADKKIILVMNKIDLIPKPTLLPLIESYGQEFDFEEVVPISATLGDGIADLMAIIVKNLPEGPAYYTEDEISDMPERFFVAEAIREKVFLITQQEIPYSSSVLVEEFKEREEGKTYIRAVIYVERNSQKGILIGKGGRTLKKLGRLAREDIEKFLQRPVYLDLWVSVKEGWRKKERDLEELGYGS